MSARANKRQPKRGRSATRAAGVDRMSVSHSLRRLERKGRAKRSPDPRHRKRRNWWMTKAGWDGFEAVAPSALERTRALLAAHGRADRAARDRLLDHFIDMLGDRARP